jgi:hypothetical protein
MNRGISFEILNVYGSFLKAMLAPLDLTAFNWYIGGEESYCVVNNETQPLFPHEFYGLEGSSLQQIIEHLNVYLTT